MSLRLVYTLLLVFFVISIPCIYLFIPSPIRVSKQIIIKGSEKNIYSLMSNANTWKRWSKKDAVNPGFIYHFSKNSYPTVVVEAKTSNEVVPIRIEIRPATHNDSAILGWRCAIPAGSMPWTRLQRYLEARQLKKDFTEVIKQFIVYTSKTKNLYGIDIAETLVKDTVIATLSRSLSTPPSTALGCEMINQLRQEVTNTGLSITGSAMTLISQAEENKYKVMVGFPVNKTPGPNINLVIKKMIPGKLLTGTVHGGPAAIRFGHEQMRKYIMDQNREEVALPYEISIISRCAEPDTSKWITKICYPVY